MTGPTTEAGIRLLGHLGSDDRLPDILAIEAEARAGAEAQLAALAEATENLQQVAHVHWRPVGTRHRWLDDLLRAEVAVEGLLVRGGLAAAAAEHDARLIREAVEAEREGLRRWLIDGNRLLDKGEAVARARMLTVGEVLDQIAPSKEADHD